MTQSAQPPVGIDLGTTYSAAAYVDTDGRPVTVANESGELLTPSALLFEGGEVVVGREAMKGSVLAPHAYAECFKRDMGQLFASRMISGLVIPPEVLSGFVLERLRLDASRRIGPVRDVVITVPAYFDETRRRATQEAGRLAGLEVVDIINEPTAAALCFGYEQGLLSASRPDSPNGRQRVLVYDLGGGTFDVTILEIEGSRFRALATDGDVRLGGRDFDGRLVDYLAQQFIAQHGADPRSDPADAAQLWLDAQEAKHTLSQRSRTSVLCFHAGIRTQIELTRPLLEDLCRDLVERTEITTSLVVQAAGLTWSDIDRVLLVGGASRIPMVGEMLQRLTGKDPDRSQSPDHAVAHGAALYAALLAGDGRTNHRCRLLDVNSHSLGVVGVHPKTREKLVSVLIAKNSTLPCGCTQIFHTARDNQRSVRVPVVEGESPRPEDCVALGECILRDLPPGLPRGERIEVEFMYAANGRISVAARVPAARLAANVLIEPEQARDLEDLNTWRLRLTGRSAVPLPPPVRGAGRSAAAGDPQQMLKRLDALHAQIGRAAAATPLTPALERIRAGAVKAEAAVGPAQTQLQAAEVANSAGEPAERLQRSARYAEAQSLLQHAQVRAELSYVALGRACAKAGVVPPGQAAAVAEANQLRERLQAAE